MDERTILLIGIHLTPYLLVHPGLFVLLDLLDMVVLLAQFLQQVQFLQVASFPLVIPPLHLLLG